MNGVERLAAFIQERHAIYTRRADGRPWPWTGDPILQRYRFCNVYRNLDTQTELIHDNWLHKSDKDVWFAMCVARLVNWWPSLAAVGFPVPWRPARFVAALDARRAAGEKVFTGAYMIRADAVDGTKATYLAYNVLQPLWDARNAVRPRAGDTLAAFHGRLTAFRDMGSFMVGQVVADVKYAVGPLARAEDWWTWAAPGPGSARGLSRVAGRGPEAPWARGEWARAFAKLQREIAPYLDQLPRISGQNLQNCLCEFDKYERVRLGEGRPRALYRPPATKERT